MQPLIRTKIEELISVLGYLGGNDPLCTSRSTQMLDTHQGYANEVLTCTETDRHLLLLHLVGQSLEFLSLLNITCVEPASDGLEGLLCLVEVVRHLRDRTAGSLIDLEILQQVLWE